MRKILFLLTGWILISTFFTGSIALGDSDSKKSGSPNTDPFKVERAKELLERGNAFMERGMTDKAQDFWKMALELDPDLAEAREKLGVSSPDSDNHKNTRPRRSDESSGGDGLTRQRFLDLISKAQAAYDRKNYPEAVKYLDAAESLSPRQPEAAALKAKINLEEFVPDPDRSFNNLVKDFFEEAIEHYRHKHYEEALRSIDQAQKLDPTHPQVQNLKARIETDYSDVLLGKEILRAKDQWNEGNGDMALEILENILKDHRKYEPALDLKSQIQKSFNSEKTGKVLGSEEKKVVKEIKRSASGHPALDHTKSTKKEIQGNEASEDAKAKADEAYNLGLQSYRKGDLASAKKLWAEALEADPQNIRAKGNLDRLLDQHPDLK